MPKKIPLHSIIVSREGKQVTPEIGAAFEFTDDEVADVDRLSPGALRDPVNESKVSVDTAKVTKTAKVDDKL